MITKWKRIKAFKDKNKLMTKYELPPLPYSFDALEPHIDAKTMEIHYTKHHQTYTNNLNAALEKCSDEIQNKDIVEILSNLDIVPAEVRGAINFNGGGFDNHRIFWSNMTPNGGGEPQGSIAEAINSTFGSFSSFKEKFTTSTVGIQGSGWGWLVFDPENNKVDYKSMPNQTSPRTEGLIPLLGCDVWEHAYYLKYQNKRPDYVNAWWNLINWKDVNERYEKARNS
ncbi:Superoxide dismutase [Mn] [Candidatus Nitrosocosmicus franklandus]|uniref:Superoxide dismutase n=2 Tax=Candidatus Nitrosocosmicus franklandianus TaxID=1798806 RepID=A0A484IAJ1_9ARCH|nr:Superoxide dismutase [Mn] [Candidatus Nitrosocosmicus franklandus]